METDKKPISLKVHETDKGYVIGACDAHLLGKTIKEKGLKLEISEAFYFERHATGEELEGLLESCMTANLVGEAVISAYCKKNPDAKDAVKRIGGVPHLQIYQL